MNKVNFFISYAHKDQDYFDSLQKGLKNYGRNSKDFHWDIWTDENILVGSLWDENIQEKVISSDIAILLITENFFASNYIKEHEFNNFIDRAKLNQTLIFPILVSPCYVRAWEDLAKIQIFKPNGAKYNKPNIGTDFTYADLIEFNKENGQLIPNPNISRYHRDLFMSIELSITDFLKKKKRN